MFNSAAAPLMASAQKLIDAAFFFFFSFFGREERRKGGVEQEKLSKEAKLSFSESLLDARLDWFCRIAASNNVVTCQD